MALYLDKINIFQLKNIDFSTETNRILVIEKPISLTILNELNIILKKFENIQLTIILENLYHGNGDNIENLGVLKFLSNVKKLKILSFSYDMVLDNLNDLSDIETLTYFSLTGHYKKSISFEPIIKHRNITYFELEWGLDKMQQTFVNSQNELEVLKVRNLDLTTFSPKEKLENLSISYKVKDFEKIPTLFPKIRFLNLVVCKEIVTFNFINELDNLEWLALRHMPQLDIFPDSTNLSKLTKLILYNNRKIKNIDTILKLENLEKLAITEISEIAASKMKGFRTLKKINSFYATFKNEKENDIFYEIAKENNWDTNLNFNF